MSKASETVRKGKKRARKGLLGYAKKEKILFFVNRNGSDNSDESEDLNYNPDEDSQTEAKKAKISSQQKPKPKLLEASVYQTSNPTMIWSQNIPYELLLKIFMYYTKTINGDMNMLVILQNVCQYWKEVASDPKLWHSVNLSLSLQNPFKHSRNSNQAVAAKRFENNLSKFIRSVNLANKFQYLERFDLSGLNNLTFDGLETVLSCCCPTTLKILSLANCKKIYSTKLAETVSFEKLIADRCSNLISLDLTGMMKPLNFTNMKYLLAKLGSNLKDLNLSQNTMTSSILAELSTSCPNLETINISGSEIKNNLDLCSFPKGLKCLHMLNTYPKTRFTTITSVLLSENDLENLKTFSTVIGSEGFRIEHKLIIAKICKDATNLKNLDLRYYKSGLDRNLNLFSMVNSTKVERLYLSHSDFTDVDQSYLVDAIRNKWASSLIEFDLAWSNIGSNYIQSIFELFEKSPECKLKILDMTGTCVETSMIKKLLKHVFVESVNLSSCRSIDRGLKRLLNKDDIKQISEN